MLAKNTVLKYCKGASLTLELTDTSDLCFASLLLFLCANDTLGDTLRLLPGIVH